MTILIDYPYDIRVHHHCSTIFAIMCAPSGTMNLVSGNILINRKVSFNHGWTLFHMTVLIDYPLDARVHYHSTPPAIMLAQCTPDVRCVTIMYKITLKFFEFRTFQEFLSHIASY